MKQNPGDIDDAMQAEFRNMVSFQESTGRNPVIGVDQEWPVGHVIFSFPAGIVKVVRRVSVPEDMKKFAHAYEIHAESRAALN